jgi:nickel-dependent lactate racemase
MNEPPHRHWEELLGDLTLETLAPSPPEEPFDRVAAMRQALDGAGVVDFARDAARRGAPLTVLVNDGHRFTDTRGFFEALFELLDRGFVRESLPVLRALVATGSHVAGAEERAAHEVAAFGPFHVRFREIAWHDSRDETHLARVGRTTLHTWMAEAGWYLACGSVEPHYFAGATGAHKTLTVGVMGLASIEANHANAMAAEARGLKLESNPVHLANLDALADLEDSGARILALNQVLVDGAVVGCAAGHPLGALGELLPLVRRAFAVTLPRPVDLVVARVLPPLDRDFYQAEKGIKNTECAVADRGVLLLEAPCPGGIGIDHFVELLRQAPTWEQAVASVEARGYRLGDHKAVRLRALTDVRGVHVGLVGGAVDPSLEDVLGVRVFADRESAASWAREVLDGVFGGAACCGVLVEDAGNVTLSVESGLE